VHRSHAAPLPSLITRELARYTVRVSHSRPKSRSDAFPTILWHSRCQYIHAIRDIQHQLPAALVRLEVQHWTAGQCQAHTAQAEAQLSCRAGTQVHRDVVETEVALARQFRPEATAWKAELGDSDLCVNVWTGPGQVRAEVWQQVTNNCNSH